MLFCLVRAVKRKGTINHQFVQRIPADVRARSAGLALRIPVGTQQPHRQREAVAQG